MRVGRNTVIRNWLVLVIKKINETFVVNLELIILKIQSFIASDVPGLLIDQENLNLSKTNSQF